MSPFLLFLFNHLDPILDFTPLIDLILAIAGTYIAERAWTTKAKHFDLLGVVLLGLGILMEIERVNHVYSGSAKDNNIALVGAWTATYT